VELTQVPGGEIIKKSTLSGLKNELKEAASELFNEAEDYFNAAD
jgi:hypothetical protein